MGLVTIVTNRLIGAHGWPVLSTSQAHNWSQERLTDKAQLDIHWA